MPKCSAGPRGDADETRSLFVCCFDRSLVGAERPRDRLDGSVYLLRNIGPAFKSVGRAEYLNDLGQTGNAQLSGTHRVSGPQIFETDVAVNPYSYPLEGPAEVNQCYTTELHVVADPPGPLGTVSGDYYGPETVCWVVAPPPPPEHTVCVQGNGECQDPLVLDLNGDGIHTTTTADPVWFDLDGDGLLEPMAWTNPATAEGFLYLDLDHKGRVTNGSELFGVGTVMPDGSRGRDGFTALAVYDSGEHGGNADGLLDSNDGVWNRLRIWVDTNHDGVCDASETGPMRQYGVQEIELAAVATAALDDSGNLHQLSSVYRRRNRDDAIHAVGFQRVQ